MAGRGTPGLAPGVADASGLAEIDGIGVGSAFGFEGSGAELVAGCAELVAGGALEAGVPLGDGSWVDSGDDVAVSAPVSSVAGWPDRIGRSVTAETAVATATKRIRRARRAPARRGWDAAMQRAPYSGPSPGTIPAVSSLLSAPALLREVGLMPDGPVPWGRPVPARGAGVFVIELPAPLPSPPIELTRVGKWLERVPTLTLDGTRPTSRALAARLASFWLPTEVILYIGATEAAIGARVAAMQRTVLGDRRPHSGGHWLHVLTALPTTRVWWAETDAVEEYEDALLSAFAAAVVSGGAGSGAAGGDIVLPFANLRRPTGERRASGLSGSLLAEAAAPPPPATRVVQVPDGDAEGARGEPPAPRQRSRRPSTPRRAAAGESKRSSPVATLTAEGAERLQAELAELIDVRRPEVVARIRSAKELGDLRENADYHAAREEQSFLEGRIQALEARLREAVIATPPSAGAGADLGSSVTVEVDGVTITYTLVGSAEAAPSAGRVSVQSPVGRALVGATPGAEVIVETPRGSVLYRVLAVE
jgi:transcription elongation factor GreA